MLLFYDYQLKSYNKWGIYGWSRKSEKLLDTHFILLFVLWSQIFNAQSAICNCFLWHYLRVTYSLKCKCRFSKDKKVLINWKCSFRNAIDFIQEPKSYFTKRRFPAPSTQNKSRKSLKKICLNYGSFQGWKDDRRNIVSV